MKLYHVVVPVGTKRRRTHVVGTGIVLFLLITLSSWRSRSSRNESTLQGMKNGGMEPSPNALYNQKHDSWVAPKEYDAVRHSWEAFPESVTSHSRDRHHAHRLIQMTGLAIHTMGA